MEADKYTKEIFEVTRISLLLMIFFSQTTFAKDYTYEAIAKRHKNVALTAQQVQKAKMEGECLVGLKNLNFKKLYEFDPVAEWTNYRSISLLEQFPPCSVLIIMEVAQSKLKKAAQNDGQ